MRDRKAEKIVLAFSKEIREFTDITEVECFVKNNSQFIRKYFGKNIEVRVCFGSQGKTEDPFCPGEYYEDILWYSHEVCADKLLSLGAHKCFEEEGVSLECAVFTHEEISQYGKDL